MPYRRNNVDFTINSYYQPMSMQEMMTPLVMYKDAYEKSEAAYEDLTSKADTFKYLAKKLEDNPDSEAAKIYKGYADELSKQAEDLARNGLSMNNRRALTNLKRRYQGEIGRLVSADEAMREEQKLRRTMNGKDSSLLYATDNLSIDDFLDGNNPNLYSVSGDDLYKRGAQAAASASSRIYNNTQVSNLTKYYQELTQSQGYSPELIAEFRDRMEAIPELQASVDAILQEKGVNDNLTGANYQRARQSVINGIIDGAVYKETKNIKDNPGVLTAAQADASARGWRGLELQQESRDFERAIAGYEKVKGEDGKEHWVWNPEKSQVLAKEKAIAEVKSTKTKSGSSTAKSSKVDLLENESYDTKTGYSGPAPSGQNATYGKEISLQEAMEEAPDLVAATGEYRDQYRYYKKGSTITRRRIHSSVTDNSQEVSVETGNGSNHNAL